MGVDSKTNCAVVILLNSYLIFSYALLCFMFICSGGKHRLFNIEKEKQNASEKCCLVAFFSGANRHGTELFACCSSEIANHTSLLALCCIALNKRFIFSMTG